MPNDISLDELPPTLREYESRQCHVCGCKPAPFGFGPPLRTPDQVLWACGAHRHQVGRIASGDAPQRAEPECRLI